MSEPESQEYAKAIAAVARHYDMGASAKTLDWFNLCTVASGIYAVRIMEIAARRREAREPRYDPSAGPTPVDAEVQVDMSSMTGNQGRPN